MQSFEFPPEIIKATGRGYDLLNEEAQEQVRKMDAFRKMAYRAAMTGKVHDIITHRNDAKTIKGEKYGVSTGVIYMAPADISGFEVCHSRTKGCSASCLFTAGQGRFPNVIQGRLRRNYTYLYRYQEFFECIVDEIDKIRNWCTTHHMVPAIRLNGTSDIAYENEDFHYSGTHYPNIFSVYPDIQFYDYTKKLERIPDIAAIPNYHVTFSRAETEHNHRNVEKALGLGVNVTVVFRKKLPPTWNGYPVVDGDRHDIRFWDGFKNANKPVVIGLLAKGQAKTDDTGFVIDVKD